MSVVLLDEVIRITEDGRIEDAETLAALLQADPGRSVDLAGAGALHTAVVQVLLAFRPHVQGCADDDFVNTWLLPVLAQVAGNPLTRRERS
jgi:hypothetical protein